MLSFLLNKQKLDEEFCWGEDYITIDENSRIRLTKFILNTLVSNNIIELWRFPALTFKGIILCPPQNEKLYRKKALNYLHEKRRDVQALEIDYRIYLSPGSIKKYDNQGRISLTQQLLKLSNIKPGDLVTILGVGTWYEVWHYDDLDNYRNTTTKILS